MGLDMYLDRHVYVGGNFEHNNVKGNILLHKGDNTIEIKSNEVKYIVTELAYWRKANHIHNWFVRNVQDGVDNCGTYYVSKEQLRQLVKACQDVLADRDKAEEILPTCIGFFFGSTEYDEYYFDQCRYTITALSKLTQDNYEVEYYYHASW